MLRVNFCDERDYTFYFEKLKKHRNWRLISYSLIDSWNLRHCRFEGDLTAIDLDFISIWIAYKAEIVLLLALIQIVADLIPA